MIYIFLVFLALIYFLLTWKKDNLSFFLIASFILFFILAFRDFNVGADTLNYVNYFLEKQRLYNAADSRDLEFGFEVYLKIVRSIWKHGTFFLLVNTVVTLSAPMFYIYKYSKNRALSLLLFLILPANLYFLHFIALRQMIAFSLLLWGLYFYKEKRSLLLLIVFFLLSASIHTTAIVVSVIFLIADKIRIGKKAAYILLFFSFILGVNKYVSIVDIASWGLSSIINSPLARIVNYIFWDELDIQVKLLFFLTVLCFLVYFYIKDELVNKLPVKLFLIGVVIMNLFSFFPIISRVVNYFLFFGVIAVTYSWTRKINKIKTILLFIVFFYFLGRTLTTLMYFDVDNETKILPYFFVF